MIECYGGRLGAVLPKDRGIASVRQRNIILSDGQSLVVEGEEIDYEVTFDTTLNEVDENYFRNVLPFSREGDYLQLDPRPQNYGRIASVSRRGRVMSFRLEDGKEFSVFFWGIDLDKVLKEGKVSGLEMKFPEVDF